jgi:undecaprenyl-diphosphatase
MPVTLIVLLVAIVAAGIVWALSRSPKAPNPADPEQEERWLVRWLGVHPRFGKFVRTVDRQAVGGLMLVAALAVVFGTALAVGVVFDMVDRGSGLARWDQAVAEWGSRNATEASTRVLDTLTNLGGTAYLTALLIGIAVYDYVRRRNADVVLFLIVTLVGIVLVNNGLKLIVDRERPPVEHLVGTSGSSFPSGHSSAAAAAWFAFALVVARHWSRRGRAVAAGVAALITFTVAASRALLGVHWLTDVVAGVAVGWGWFLLSALVFGGRMQRLGDPAARTAARGAARATTPNPLPPSAGADPRRRVQPARAPSAPNGR